jgi:hypothetical protein
MHRRQCGQRQNLEHKHMADGEKTKLSPTSKVLIGAATLMLGLIVGLAISIGFFFVQLKSPQYQKSVAASVADFADPLPAGFKIESGTSVESLKAISFRNQPDNMWVVFNVRDVKNDAEKKDSEETLKQEHNLEKYEEDAPQILQIAGHSMEYRTRVTGSEENKMTVLDGVIEDVPNKFISVTAGGKSPFNFALFKQFTDAIRSFNTERSR